MLFLSLAEKNERWERERVLREKERRKEMDEWSKKCRFEKIRKLKEEMRDRKDEESRKKSYAEIRSAGWKVWRQKENPTEEGNSSPIPLAPLYLTCEHTLLPFLLKVKETVSPCLLEIESTK